MKRVFALLAGVISGLFLAGTALSADYPEHPWPMFRGDAQHTGRSIFNGPSAGAVKWTFQTGGPVVSSPAVAADGTIYIGSDDGRLYAVNPDGALKWSYNAASVIRSSPAIAPDGTVYFGAENGIVYALNPDGTLKWSYLTVLGTRFPSNPVPYSSSPVIDMDGTIYIGSKGGYLYSFSPEGDLNWSVQITHPGGPVNIYATPAIGEDGTVYVGTKVLLEENHARNYGPLYAFNPDGTLKWSNAWVSEGSPAIDPDGAILNPGSGLYLYQFNSSGAWIWLYRTDAPSISSPAITDDGTVKIGSKDGYLHSVNPDGSLDWKYKVAGDVISSPAIDADGNIYVSWVALNSDGTLKWKIAPGTGLSSPAIGSDNTIYVGAGNYLYAISDGYSISGKITLVNGTGPVTGVKLVLGGSVSQTKYPDSEGNFSFTHLSQGDYAITPVLDNYTFSPSSREYSLISGDMTAQDFTGNHSHVDIKGRIFNESGAGLANATVTFSSGGGTAQSNSEGIYTKKLPIHWSGQSAASYPGYNFIPAVRTYTDVTGNLTAQAFKAKTVLIAGHVKTASGTGVAGVSVNFSGYGPVITNAAGYYSKRVKELWTGTVTPSLAGYTFTPANAQFTSVVGNKTANFSVDKVRVSGTVQLGSGLGLGGVKVTFNNNGGIVYTDSTGAYSNLVTCGWSGRATPSKTGFIFTPPYRSYGDLCSPRTGRDYTAAPQ